MYNPGTFKMLYEKQKSGITFNINEIEYFVYNSNYSHKAILVNGKIVFETKCDSIFSKKPEPNTPSILKKCAITYFKGANQEQISKIIYKN